MKPSKAFLEAEARYQQELENIAESREISTDAKVSAKPTPDVMPWFGVANPAWKVNFKK